MRVLLSYATMLLAVLLVVLCGGDLFLGVFIGIVTLLSSMKFWKAFNNSFKEE